MNPPKLVKSAASPTLSMNRRIGKTVSALSILLIISTVLNVFLLMEFLREKDEHKYWVGHFYRLNDQHRDLEREVRLLRASLDSAQAVTAEARVQTPTPFHFIDESVLVRPDLLDGD
jgi:hypothetical protein